METLVMPIPKKTFINSPPFFLCMDDIIYALMEDLKPYPTKEEGKLKIIELKLDNQNKKYRLKKHQGMFFVYKKN